MRTEVWTALFAFMILRSAGQGTVNFANGAAGVDAPVNVPGVVELPEGPQWQAELLLVTEGGSSQRLGEPVSFRTGALAGYFFGGSVIAAGTEAGMSATFRVRAFDTAGFAEILSNPVMVTLGGGKLPPPNLVGLESWREVAATPKLKVSISDNVVTLFWSKDFPNALLEFSDSLTSLNWIRATQTRQVEENSFTVTVLLNSSERFYRLRLN